MATQLKQIIIFHRHEQRTLDLNKWLNFFANLPRQYEFMITVQRRQARYSAEQRSLIHIWLREIGEFLGYHEDEVKAVFKARPRWPKEDTPLGPMPIATEHLYKDQASDVLDDIQDVARGINGLVLSRKEE